MAYLPKEKNDDTKIHFKPLKSFQMCIWNFTPHVPVEASHVDSHIDEGARNLLNRVLVHPEGSTGQTKYLPRPVHNDKNVPLAYPNLPQPAKMWESRWWDMIHPRQWLFGSWMERCKLEDKPEEEREEESCRFWDGPYEPGWYRPNYHRYNEPRYWACDGCENYWSKCETPSCQEPL